MVTSDNCQQSVSRKCHQKYILVICGPVETISGLKIGIDQSESVFNWTEAVAYHETTDRLPR